MAADHARIGARLGAFAELYEDLRQYRDETGATVTLAPLGRVETTLEALFDADATDRLVLGWVLSWIQRTRAAVNGCIAELVNGPFAAWVLNDLRVQTSSRNTGVIDILRDHAETMLTDAKDLLENTIAIGTAIAAAASNVGNGTIILSIKEPIEKRSQERINADSFTIVCESDSFSNGVTPGQETFIVQSKLLGLGFRINVPGAVGYDAGYNRLENGSFESWDVGITIPDDWAVIGGAGTAGTHIVRESTIKIWGTYALKLLGNNTHAATEIGQVETAFSGYSTSQRIKPQTCYLISAKIRTSGMGANTLFEIEPKGTGITAASTEKITRTAPGTVAWANYSAVWITPKTIPSDIYLSLKQSISAGNLQATDIVYVEDVVLSEMFFWPESGTYWGAMRGTSLDFVALPRQDYFTCATTNTLAAKIQSFLTRVTDRTVSAVDVRKHPDLSRMWPSAAAASADYDEATVCVL